MIEIREAQDSLGEIYILIRIGNTHIKLPRQDADYAYGRLKEILGK